MTQASSPGNSRQRRNSVEEPLPSRGRAAVPDVVTALKRMDGQLAAQEQKVADYVKAHLEDISRLTIAELASAVGVSKPTVIRFCRSLGCDGFREFKLRLVQNLAVSLQYLDPQYVRPGEPADELDSILSSLYASANQLRQQLDRSLLLQAAEAVANARQVLVSGIGGGSSVMAEEAANRLFRLGIPSLAISDSYLLQMRAATLTEADVVVLLSVSGEAEAIVGAANVADSYGVTSIAITAPDSRLAERVSIPILIDLPENPDIFKPTSSRYTTLIVIDVLAMLVAQVVPERSTDTLRKIRSSLTAYHGRVGPQPLGD